LPSVPILHVFFFFFLLIPRLPRSTLFPYTTLFRSTAPPEPKLGVVNPKRCVPVAPNNGIVVSATARAPVGIVPTRLNSSFPGIRSEEHTSELQSRGHLVCRLLLEKKKKKKGRTRCI